MKPIWIVDDDQSIRWVLEKALARENFATRSFSGVRDALAGSPQQREWARAVSTELGPLASDETRTAIRRAESRPQALTMLLMAPEFQRR